MIDSIYEVALELIKDIGVNFKMDDIAKKMNISKKTIYKHYPSKEILIKRMIDECEINVHSDYRTIIYNNNLSEVNKLFLMLDVTPKEAILYTRNVLSGLKHYYPELAILLTKHLESKSAFISTQFNYAQLTNNMNKISFTVFYSMYNSMFELWQKSIESDFDTIKEETLKVMRKGLIIEI